ncbi:MAG: polyprenyl diphosphate synthase [Candidatus Thermoplasmatota archaeon]|jgi:tritrans,polycis-undecaprenyl-diphosphate synthase [geranylgeranyl-diphosphate specific]|nr:polyprenyl diphosphate synthase [Candidatus Thermoplasmatota archaeon]
MSLGRKIGDITGELYEKILMEQVMSGGPIPKHIGIITDGNRRYAREHGIDPNSGHVRGKDKLEEVLEWSMEIGTKIITVYGFSTENFQRDPGEVDFLLNLINDSLRNLMKDNRVVKNRIKVKVIGKLNVLPPKLVDTISELEKFTNSYENFRLNIAVGYGGREEIMDAIRKISRDYSEGKISMEDITQDKFREYLYDGTLPDPELILRTSGEERISNFLLWQSAYSELYFSDVYWPALKKTDFLKAIRAYQLRQRRYGK